MTRQSGEDGLHPSFVPDFRTGRDRPPESSPAEPGAGGARGTDNPARHPCIASWFLVSLAREASPRAPRGRRRGPPGGDRHGCLPAPRADGMFADAPARGVEDGLPPWNAWRLTDRILSKKP